MFGEQTWQKEKKNKQQKEGDRRGKLGKALAPSLTLNVLRWKASVLNVLFFSLQNVVLPFPPELIKLKSILKAEGLDLTVKKECVSKESDLHPANM